jgi:hypothetical protein
VFAQTLKIYTYIFLKIRTVCTIYGQMATLLSKIVIRSVTFLPSIMFHSKQHIFLCCTFCFTNLVFGFLQYNKIPASKKLLLTCVKSVLCLDFNKIYRQWLRYIMLMKNTGKMIKTTHQMRIQNGFLLHQMRIIYIQFLQSSKITLIFRTT